VIKKFHGNPDVVFGDVTLSKSQVQTIHGTAQSPGSGGWPTVRHFNKATGYGGQAYAKKTSEAMCDELGPKNDYMQQYVEEAGGTSLCNAKKPESGCSDKQKDFITKWDAKPKADLQKQVERLTGMVDKDGASMKPEALTWAKQRLAIVKQLHRDEL
jgi:hypothetical protein